MKFFIFIIFYIPIWANAWVGIGLKEGIISFKSHVRFDSSQSQKSQIDQQLKYLFGNFNNYGGGLDFPKRIISNNQIVDGVLSYSVQVPVVIPETLNSIEIILPNDTSVPFLKEFVGKYQKKCGRKSSTVETFWNYIIPHVSSCKWNNSDIIRVIPEIYFKESGDLFSRKWTNGKLIKVVSIFTQESATSSEGDLGIGDFLEFKSFLEKYKILTKNERIIELNEIKILFVSLKVKSGDQNIEATLLLTPNLNQDVKAQINILSPFLYDADFISFNGHSGMGQNIQDLEEEILLSPIKPQILFLNSCDTLGYFSGKILKDLDSTSKLIILNSLPNFFGTMGASNVKLLKLLIGSSFSFKELLGALPESQGAVLELFNQLN